MPLTVKFHLLGEDQKVKVIRKIELDIYVENTFEILLERVQDLFNLPADKISLFYKDDDGDLVMFVSDEEMRIGQRNRKADTFSVYIKDHIRPDQMGLKLISGKSLIVKFHLLGEDQKVKVIRKIELDIYSEKPFEFLLERVQDLFNLPADKISLFYKDEDGDLVMFTSDEEMRIGLRYHKADTFSVYVRGSDGDL